MSTKEKKLSRSEAIRALIRPPSKLTVLMVLSLLNLFLAWLSIYRFLAPFIVQQYVTVALACAVLAVLWELGEYIRARKRALKLR